MPSPDAFATGVRGEAATIAQLPHARQRVGITGVDLTMTNAGAVFEVCNHTSHRNPPFGDPLPLQQAAKMASAKTFALGMQGEETCGGEGAPAHFVRSG